MVYKWYIFSEENLEIGEQIAVAFRATITRIYTNNIHFFYIYIHVYEIY